MRERSHPIVCAVIGGGKVGTVLGRLLIRGGGKVSCVISRSISSAKAAARFIGCRTASTRLSDIPADVNLLMIATPHAAVGSVAASLADLGHLRFAKLSACHMSGMLSSSVLEPIAKKGATVFSFHPLQTFPRDFAPQKILSSIKGIYYGVDGNRSGIRKARKLALLLGGKTIEIPAEMRPLYHAACVVASNHLTGMLWILEQMYGVLTGRSKDFYPVFRPIIEATLRNVSLTSPVLALSGPVARGGVETVSGHLQAIRSKIPSVLPYFLQMTEETARMALAKGSVTEGQVEAIVSLVRQFQQERELSRKSV